MRQRGMVRILVVLGAGLLGASPASAVGGWFVGVNAGRAELQDFRLSVTTSDDTDVAPTVLGGYQFGKHFGVGGGYVDLGEYHFEGSDFGGYVTDIEAEGVHLFTLGILPIAPRWAAFGTAGLFRWDVKQVDLDIPTMFVRRLSETGTSPTYGVGFNFDAFAKSGINFHLGWQTFLEVGDRHTVEHENDYRIISAGMTYHFGK